MENILTQITDYLLTQSWQIAALVVVIAVVSMAVKNKSAHVRYLLWLIVLAKCLVPPLYKVPLAVLPQRLVAEAVVTAPAQMPTFSPEVIDVMPREAVPAPVLPAAPVAEAAAPRRPAMVERLGKVTLGQWLGFGWIAGAAVFLTVALMKALRTNRWLKRQRRPLPEKLQSRIAGFLAAVGVRRTARVWLIGGVGQPFVWGVLRGDIYLPSNFSRVNGGRGWRAVLDHELSHVLRYDAGVNLLQIIAQAVYWFHPFVWWANKKIRAEREKCCDEMAIARLGSKARDYSAAIVNTLIAEHKARHPVPSLAIAGPVKNIEDRIKTIMKSGRKFYRRPTFITVITVLVLAAVAVPTTLALTRRTDKTPAGRAEAEVEVGFGPVIERVVAYRKGFPSEAVPESGPMYLDLDTGAYVGFKVLPTSEMIRKSGVDVYYEPVARGAGMRLTTSNLQLQPLSEKTGWDRDPKFVRRALEIASPYALMPPERAPVAFMTRDSGIGILQILGFTKDGQGIRIRYKIVQNDITKKMVAEVEKETTEETVRDVLYETYDIGTAGWSPMVASARLEKLLEVMRRQPRMQKLFAIAARGTDAQKKALLQSVKRMCNVYLNDLPEFQSDPNAPWQATVVHSPGVMAYPPLLLQLEDDPSETLDMVTRMYLRMQDARAKYWRAKGAREYIGWGTSDTGTIMAFVCHSCMSRLGSDTGFQKRATAEQLSALREYEDHCTKSARRNPADDELNVMKFAERIHSHSTRLDSDWGQPVEGLRMAVEFVPEKDSYSMGGQIGVRLNIQNVSDSTITVARVTGQTDPGYWIIEDSTGVRVTVNRVRWMGPRRIDRRVIKPGETTVLEIEPLWILKSSSEGRGHVWAFIDRPGVYSARYKLSLEGRQHGDWSGSMESGTRKLVIGPEGLSKGDDPKSPLDEDAILLINLPDTIPLVDFLNFVAHHLQVDYLYDPSEVVGTVSLEVNGNLPTRMRGKDLYLLFEDIMRSNGFVATRSGNLVTIRKEKTVEPIAPIVISDQEHGIETPLENTARAEVPPTAEQVWGQPVEGLQCRLSADKITWKAGEIPTLKADVRNQGTSEFLIYRTQQLCELSIDGQWYRHREVHAKSSPFPPGKQYNGIDITLDKRWYSKGAYEPLQLQPGKHIIHVTFVLSDARKGSIGPPPAPVRVLSNPVEIEILPAQSEGDTDSGVLWGEAVEGVRMRVHPERVTWYEGQIPKFLVDMRNNGTVECQLGLTQDRWEVELDGLWYRVGAIFSGRFRTLPLGPGQQHKDIEFSPGEWSEWNINGKPLKFTPGWHTVRLAFHASTRGAYQALRLVSNPVFIEVLPAGEKVDTVADEADAATMLEADLYEVWRQRDRDLAGAEAFGKKLLEKYTEPEQQALIYYQLAEIYAQNPRVAPSKTIEYAEQAWWHLHDPVKKARLFVYWADAVNISKGRREAARICLRGLKFCLQFGLPKDRPERPAVGRYTIDGPPEVVAEYRRRNQLEMAAWKQAKLIEDLIQHRQALTSQIVQWYAAEPDAFDELRELVMKYLHSEEVAEQLITAAKAYRKNHKTPIPVITRMGPDLDPEADLHWGDAVEGIQCRLRADKVKWEAEEKATFKVCIRNRGSRQMRVDRHSSEFEVECDGRWYCRAVLDVSPYIMRFGPGREYDDITISLDKGWATKKDGEPLRPAEGKHKVRVALTAEASEQDEGEAVRVVSNPVQIEILPAQPRSDFTIVGAVRESGSKRIRVFGRVLDRPGGQGVAGVKVKLWSDWMRQSRFAVTDEDSSYRFDDVVPGPYLLRVTGLPGIWTEGAAILVTSDPQRSGKTRLYRASGQGYRIAEVGPRGRSRGSGEFEALIVGPGQKQMAELYLELSQSVSGTVRDEATGEPVAGVGLHFLSLDMLRPTVYTDAQGRYRLYLPSGEVHLACEGTEERYYPGPGNKPQERNKTVTVRKGEHVKDLDFEVHSAPTFSGEVVMADGSKAPEGMDVNVVFAWRQKNRMTGGGIFYDGQTRRELKTDKDGRFREHVRSPHGEQAFDRQDVSITAYALTDDFSYGGMVWTGIIELAEPKIEPIRIVMTQTGSIEFGVIDPNGKGVEGASIRGIDIFWVIHGKPWRPIQRDARMTDLGQGRYRVDGLIAGFGYIPHVEAAGYRHDDSYTAHGDPIVVQAGQHVKARDIKLEWNDARAVPRLLTLIGPDSGSFIVGRLGRIGPEAAEAVPVLVEILKESTDKATISSTVAALGKIGVASEAVVEALIDVVETKRGYPVNVAVEVLAGMGVTEAIEPIKNALEEGRVARRFAEPALWRLKKLGIARPAKRETTIRPRRTDVGVHKQLGEIADLSGLNPEMSFGAALEQIRNSAKPRLNIVVLWGDLEKNAEIDRNTPINMEPISAVRLGTALELLLKSVSAGAVELGYVVDDGIIIIATKESLPKNLKMRTYNIAPMVSR